MTKDPTVLILDDDEKWLALHERRLSNAGCPYCSTQLAKEAIQIGKTYSSIKFALIDELLFLPPDGNHQRSRQLQDWQGSDVVREISDRRSDVSFIFVTSAPKDLSQQDSQILIREEAKLRRQRGVIDLIHKQEIEENADAVYNWLVQLLKQPQLPASSGELPQPKILIGLAVPAEVLQNGKKRRLRQCLKDAGASGAELNQSVSRFLEQVRPPEKILFIEAPGSKKLDPCFGIKANSQSFHLLEVLAQKAEQGQETTIEETDYHYVHRRARDDIKLSPDLDPREIQDFAYDLDTDGRKRRRDGVQFEARSGKSSTLKVAIARLRKQLAKLNLGPKSQLLQFEQNCYRPSFETGILLYAEGTVKRRHR